MKKWFDLRNPIVTVIALTVIAFVIFSFGVYANVSWIKDSVPSFYIGITTLLVGSYAFTLYKKQRVDYKKEAANIILLEIQSAESVLKLAQRSLENNPPTLPYDVIVMPTESWTKNKYLFVGDFDSNQWDAISGFYNTCELFDNAVRTNASYFQKNEEQIRVNIQHRASDLARHYSHKIDRATTVDEKANLKIELRKKTGEEMDLYLGAAHEYTPQKPITDAKLCMETIKLNISLPDAISKLKELTK